MTDINENAVKFAKILAFPDLMISMSNSGVMACNPKYVTEALDKRYAEYLFHSERTLIQILDLVKKHPEGADGLKKDLADAYSEYRKTLPPIDDML